MAIYAELNGSNEWNGSVLAIMLVAGTIGALLPTWLKHDTEVIATSPGTTTSTTDSMHGVDNKTEEFASTVHTDTSDSTSTPAATVASSTTSPATFTATSEFTVGTRITIAGVLSCVNLLLFVLTWEVVASVAFLALFFATWQYINVVTFARLALALKVAQVESTVAVSGDNLVSGIAGDERLTEQERQLSVDLVPHTIICAPVTTGATGSHLNSTVHSNSKQCRQSRNSNDVGISLHNPNSLSALHTSAPSNSHHATETANPTTHSIERDSLSVSRDDSSDTPDPPYSVALVTIIALNAAVQIILQAIAFSGLALPLRTSCYVFVLVFCVSTVLYVAALLILFGVTRMRTGVSKLFTK